MNTISKLTGLNDLESRVVEFRYKLPSEFLYSKFLKAKNDSDVLVVYFHGAIERSRRKIPSYYPIDKEISRIAHQITLCDPTMTAKEGFPLSWFAGHEKFNCQEELKTFFKELKKSLNIKKVIYVGSSGGGFAALYFSFFDEDSAVLTMVPQTSIATYHRPKAFEMYSKACWSSMNVNEVRNKACIDVNSLYANGFNNSIVYMQSSGDVEHFSSQLVPFVKSLEKCDNFKNNFILDNTYYGKYGHSGVITKEDYTPYLLSLIENDVKNKESVLNGFYLKKKELYEGDEGFMKSSILSSGKKVVDNPLFVKSDIYIQEKMADF